ncbi:hypothetical protein M5K25_008301 [Dendrobium thyrsiflorum]|uniref:Uncharacterized protein n=1 Tax=Dendrobium thyrsiflorum TaxID=117978 RepID=A0ABD0V7N0_DENTH
MVSRYLVGACDYGRSLVTGGDGLEVEMGSALIEGSGQERKRLWGIRFQEKVRVERSRSRLADGRKGRTAWRGSLRRLRGWKKRRRGAFVCPLILTMLENSDRGFWEGFAGSDTNSTVSTGFLQIFWRFWRHFDGYKVSEICGITKVQRRTRHFSAISAGIPLSFATIKRERSVRAWFEVFHTKLSQDILFLRFSLTASIFFPPSSQDEIYETSVAASSRSNRNPKPPPSSNLIFLLKPLCRRALQLSVPILLKSSSRKHPEMGMPHDSPEQPDAHPITAVNSRQWALISKYRTSIRMQSPKVEVIDPLFKPTTEDDDDGIIRERLWIPIRAFEAYNQENSLTKEQSLQRNPILCRQVDKVDRVRSVKRNDSKHPDDGRVEPKQKSNGKKNLQITEIQNKDDNFIEGFAPKDIPQAWNPQSRTSV